ncbi:conserved hypothetical protein [Gloeothece citriformis PCC 7424]|uniref:Uncharacterized protein n=1 Tax=Gloeothece citriformis (strain PCC 7424) TaxID=65393 RepID=B7KIP0_GLOC7|nr:hypothetical protein [Gloeothece citriformis]ACK69446.1 conserved hypothetical protein [Gloeothece citriformis PCC 7424]
MKIVRANSNPISEKDQKILEKLKGLIERSVADGRVSKDEMESIKTCINSNGKIIPQEIELCQKLIWDKIQTGELTYDWADFS